MAITTAKLQDPNLSEKEQDEIIGAFIKQQEDQRLRKRWEEKLSQEYGISKKTTPPRRAGATIRKIGLALAAVAASLLLLFAILPQFSATDGQELLAAYVEEVKIDAVRDLATAGIDTLRRAFATEFTGQRFAAAATVGERLIALPAATDEDVLNLGEAYLRDQQFSRADNLFQQLIDQNSAYLTEARFNLALSLLSQQKTTEGLAELQKISAADGNRMYRAAQELLAADW